MTKAFIKVESGEASISGGLIFHPGKFIVSDRTYAVTKLNITGNSMYSTTPSRWDLLGWLGVRRKIMGWMGSHQLE